MYGILEDTESNPNVHHEKDEENYKDEEEKDDTQDMKMEHTEEYIILYHDEDKGDDVIDE